MARALGFLLLSAILVAAAGPACGTIWLRAAGGVADMAMADINDADLSWYETSVDGFNLPDVGTGFLLDLAVGYDSPGAWGVGFHWDRQWASTEGTDVDVDATLNLDAHHFAVRVYWWGLRAESWQLAAVGGLGPLFTDGSAEVTRGTVSFGDSRLRGTTWGLDAGLVLQLNLKENTGLHLCAGWRQAEISSFKADDVPVVKADGSDASLDYSGWVLKAGVRWSFPEDD